MSVNNIRSTTEDSPLKKKAVKPIAKPYFIVSEQEKPEGSNAIVLYAISSEFVKELKIKTHFRNNPSLEVCLLEKEVKISAKMDSICIENKILEKEPYFLTKYVTESSLDEQEDVVTGILKPNLILGPDYTVVTEEVFERLVTFLGYMPRVVKRTYRSDRTLNQLFYPFHVSGI